MGRWLCRLPQEQSRFRQTSSLNMSDELKPLDLLIRTRAELQGAQATLESFERQIGKSKALGKETAELEKRATALRSALVVAAEALDKKSEKMDRAAQATKVYKEELADLEQQLKN